jgi:hypothetical protein
VDAVIGVPAGAAEVADDTSIWGPADIHTTAEGRGAVQWFTVGPRGVAIHRDVIEIP